MQAIYRSRRSGENFTADFDISKTIDLILCSYVPPLNNVTFYCISLYSERRWSRTLMLVYGMTENASTMVERKAVKDGHDFKQRIAIIWAAVNSF